MTACWEHFEHEADVGVRGIGETKAQAFEQAALALTAVVTSLDKVLPRNDYHIECEADDDEILLVEWLNQLIYEMATRNLLFNRFQVTINNGHLTATCFGEHINIARHHPAVEIKGATFTELQVRQSGTDWIAQTVVDV